MDQTMAKQINEAPPPAQDKRQRLPPLLRAAWYGLNQAFRRRIAHTGITPDQFTVLRTLHEEGSLSQRELTAKMNSDPNTISSLINRMVKAGLLERKKHEKDGRAYLIDLKPRGLQIFEETRKIALHLKMNILQAIPEEDVDAFIHNLEILAQACQKATEEQ